MPATNPIQHPIEATEEHQLTSGHADVRRMVKTAVVTGDIDLLRQALFEPTTWFDGERSRWVMKPGLARALKEGLDDEELGKPIHRDSFAELCFDENRPEMLREVLESVRPAYVDGHYTANSGRWMQLLCMRFVYGEHSLKSLLNLATFEIKPHSRDFIQLSLEFNPADMAIHGIKFNNAEACALVTECEMSLRIRQELAKASVATPPTTLESAVEPRARRRTL